VESDVSKSTSLKPIIFWSCLAYAASRGAFLLMPLVADPECDCLKYMVGGAAWILLAGSLIGLLFAGCAWFTRGIACGSGFTLVIPIFALFWATMMDIYRSPRDTEFMRFSATIGHHAFWLSGVVALLTGVSHLRDRHRVRIPSARVIK
jgi:hypothetical protein